MKFAWLWTVFASFVGFIAGDFLTVGLSRPFPGEIRVSFTVGKRKLRVEWLGWLWTKSIIAVHRPLGADLRLSARFLWFDVSLWRCAFTPPRLLSSVSRLSIVSRITHDLAQMRRIQ